MSICAGSVPNRELFEEWAAKKVDLPRLSECFELRRSESLGIHAVARWGAEVFLFWQKAGCTSIFVQQIYLIEENFLVKPWWNIYVYIYIASPPPQGLPFKIKSCFQRKVCISDFVRWYSYISNVFLNCFQCNVWVSTRGFAMAVKQFFMFNSSFERINNRWCIQHHTW